MTQLQPKERELLAIIQELTEEQATPVVLRRKLALKSGKTTSYGEIYLLLGNLENAHFVNYTHEPGGVDRAFAKKLVYSVTERGLHALKTPSAKPAGCSGKGLAAVQKLIGLFLWAVILWGVLLFVRDTSDNGIPTPLDYSLVNVDGLLVKDAKGKQYRLQHVRGHYHFVRKVK